MGAVLACLRASLHPELRGELCRACMRDVWHHTHPPTQQRSHTQAAATQLRSAALRQGLQAGHAFLRGMGVMVSNNSLGLQPTPRPLLSQPKGLKWFVGGRLGHPHHPCPCSLGCPTPLGGWGSARCWPSCSRARLHQRR